MRLKKTYFKRAIACLFVLAMCFSIFTQTASALSQKQINEIIDKSYYYNVDECAPDQASGSVTAGSGTPTGAAFPNLDPGAMASAIDKWILQVNSKSKMKGLGEVIVASAKQSNINPFLIVVLARKESLLSDPANYNVINGANSFGRQASSSQPSFPGSGPAAGVSWYKWSTVKASVDYTAQENKGISGGGDMASYLSTQYSDQIQDNDLTALMMEYAPPGENDTATYVQEIKTWTKELVKLTGNSSGSSSGSSSSSSSSSGQASTSGTGSAIKSVYMRGDSITVGALTSGNIKEKFKAAGINATVTASGAGTVSRGGGSQPSPGDPISGLEALQRDKDKVKNSDAVVVAYGTNNFPSEIASEMKAMVSKIRSINDDATIFWVNTATDSSMGQSLNGQKAYTKAASKEKSDIMDKKAEDLDLTVIDTRSANIPLDDGIHPTYDEKGMGKWSKTVVDGVKSGGSTAADSEPSANCKCGPEESSTLTGKNNEERVWNYFTGEKGLDDHLVAGIMGNISQESGFDPTIAQTGGNVKDPSVFGTDVGIGKAWGLIQWDAGGRAPAYAKQAGIEGDIAKLKTQLDVIWWHLNKISPTGQTNAIKEFEKAKNPKDAASSWEHLIEGAGTPAMENRWAAAEAAMKKYGGSSPEGGVAMGSPAEGSDASCTCEASGGTTVVLDPGHSGTIVEENNDPSGVKAADSVNDGERQDMWKVSQAVTSQLESKGFKIINTKKNANDSVGLIERAKIANDANAAIAVSLHSTPGRFGSADVGWVTPQETGLYRQTGSNKKTFSDAKVAKTSQDYSEKILTARKEAEGGVAIHKLDFPASRGLPATGNISIVQLFSKVPWVYNEAGQTGLNTNKYADGVARGIISALGQSDAGSSATCGGGGDLIGTLQEYAWPEYHAAPYLKRTDAWAKVADDPKSHYVGGSVSGVKGIDCGGFVTMLVRNSGFDPDYNKGKGATGSASDENSQWGYLDKNWKKINPSSTKDLEPGDVAINSSHTFIHVGDVEGFGDVFASASYSTSGNGRAPMAGGDDISGYTWYRIN